MRTRRALTIIGLLGITAGALTTTVTPVAAQEGFAMKLAKGEFKIPVVQTKEGLRKMPAVSGAVVEAARAALQARGQNRANTQSGSDEGGTLGVAPKTLGCSQRNTDGNVRVNQDCTYRRQAETIIKFNPADPNNLIAGQNDSRVGYNHCGFDYSFNGGQTWGDGIPPFYGHTNFPAAEEPTAADPNRHTIGGGPGTAHTYDAGSDPILAADSMGRAFFGCVLFDINSNASTLSVTQSPAGAGGSFYDNVPDHNYNVDDQGNLVSVTGGRRFIVAEDNNGVVTGAKTGVIFHDKPFVVADFISNTPKRDNLYVTWTVFQVDPRCKTSDNPSGQCESPIFGSMSTNHGLTWSTPEEISGVSPLCVTGTQIDPLASANACNQDQGSDPIVRPDGSLVVVFNNTNGTHTNPGQQLAVVCHPAGSSPAGTAHLNCSPTATRVGNDVVTGEPQCDFGRGPEECIPGAYIRTNDFPRVAINRGNGHLYATWQDYRSGEYDIQLSESTDGGVTWTEAKAPVNPSRNKDHYFPAIDVVASGHQGEEDHSAKAAAGAEGEGNGSGDHVAVSYYRTDRVPNENTTPVGGFAPCSPAQFGGPPCQPGVGAENSDYTLAGGFGLNTPYAAERVSPIFPPPDGNQTGFNGDYSGLTVVGNIAHPMWSDTRNAVPQQINSQPPGQSGISHDEDAFTTTRPVPSGHGEQSGG